MKQELGEQKLMLCTSTVLADWQMCTMLQPIHFGHVARAALCHYDAVGILVVAISSRSVRDRRCDDDDDVVAAAVFSWT